MKKKSRKTLYRSILVRLIVCTLLPMLLFSLIFYHQIQNSYFHQAAKAEQKSMQTKNQAFFDQMQLITYAARGIYFNTTVMALLNGTQTVSNINEQHDAEDYIFGCLANALSMVPDSEHIQLVSYKQGKRYLLHDNYNREVTDAPELPEPEQLPRPYTSYILPGDGDSAGFTVCLPFYDPPSISDCLGEIRITIPQERLEQLCAALYRPESGESLHIFLPDGQLLYASGSPDTDIDYLYANQTSIFNVCHMISIGKRTFLEERLDQKSVDLLIVRDITNLVDIPEINQYLFLLMVLFAISLLLVILLMSFSISRFTVPLKQLASYTHSVNMGNLNTDIRSFINYHSPDEIGALIDDVGTMMNTINTQVIKAYRIEAANKTLKLHMLQAQIAPHFLHNTLQCLAAEALEYDDHTLYSAIASLGNMMHYSMDTDRVNVPFSEEIDYCKNYLFLLKMRFPIVPDIFWDISPSVSQKILPKMLLQPLIENAIRHGEIFKTPGCSLHIRASCDSCIRIQVSDTGKGISKERLQLLVSSIQQVKESVLTPNWKEMIQSDIQNSDTDSPEPPESMKQDVHTLHSHIGLKNVYLRLLLQYHTDCQMVLRRLEPHGFEITLLIPAAPTESLRNDSERSMYE